MYDGRSHNYIDTFLVSQIMNVARLSAFLSVFYIKVCDVRGTICTRQTSISEYVCTTQTPRHKREREKNYVFVDSLVVHVSAAHTNTHSTRPTTITKHRMPHRLFYILYGRCYGLRDLFSCEMYQKMYIFEFWTGLHQCQCGEDKNIFIMKNAELRKNEDIFFEICEVNNNDGRSFFWKYQRKWFWLVHFEVSFNSF